MIADGSVLDTVAHVVAAVMLLAGSFLAMVAGIGIARFPDLLARMHAATKPQVLGLALLMGGLALEIRTGVVIWTLVLVVALQLITAPVSAHMVGRAGYRTSQVRSDLLVVDELTDDLAVIERMADREGAAGRQMPAPSSSTGPSAGAGDDLVQGPEDQAGASAKAEAVEEEVLATRDPQPHDGAHEDTHEPPSGRS
ncbi:monovalent cation/H(+) antiporter subunit G [Serinibacter arcticus]|uniref:Na(+) H(+) antiporter subunit G n=1 Tax=Serinibacter arcticus TaxID=1655435 RepID=A0A4Z1E465_9MICO|nr:Na(+) H(+) antiporter subunit G [Serinibacter arcticus]